MEPETVQSRISPACGNSENLNSNNPRSHRRRRRSDFRVSSQNGLSLVSCWTIIITCTITLFILTGVSLVAGSLSSSDIDESVSLVVESDDRLRRSPQRGDINPQSQINAGDGDEELINHGNANQTPPKYKRTIFAPPGSHSATRNTLIASNSLTAAAATNFSLRQPQILLLQQHQQQQQQNIGNYSRTYFEKHFLLNANNTQVFNQTIESEAKLEFGQENPKIPHSKIESKGVLNVTARNESFDIGESSVVDSTKPVSTTKFTNVTYFNGVAGGTSGGGGRRKIVTSNTNGNNYNVESSTPADPHRGLGATNHYNNNNNNIHPLTTLDENGKNHHRKNGKPAYITRPHPCEQNACYPATGNLLIGRETNLTASSTCGLRGEERYCIVSHLEDKKKCFRCDSTDRHIHNPGLSHRVNNILDRFYPGTHSRSWWQSENGVETVHIQLNLEAEFHFTHLIITFKTFRPAAMLIERSIDHGRTWKVYRYFAYDCEHSFPEIPERTPINITDVVCESRYSAVAPSTEGEIIFRVLPRNIEIADPYSKDVQDLLRMTNLRINFTKLHTLGDDRLDRRQEITEKYYYAIYEMVVRGSCSCYGHASRCLPSESSPGLFNYEAKPDMVHGRCECTHNTKGANCDECEDFYHDLEWRPAFKKQLNQCQKCECNDHASSCHFSEVEFEKSGKISGGVCDNCRDNTVGAKCDKCADMFFQRDDRRITDVDACAPCECSKEGSMQGGRCVSKTDLSDPDNQMIAGTCDCKNNVTGRYCDICKRDHWNLTAENDDGCQLCDCEPSGTVAFQGCNMRTGQCTCKRHVTGRFCNQCNPEFWGLDRFDEMGCKQCDCDVGGAYNNNCDMQNGTCSCRGEITERTCNAPKKGFYVPNLDHLLAEAELARDSSNCQVVVKEPPEGGNATWSGTGYLRCFDDAMMEFTIDNVMTSMDYELVIRYTPSQPGGWQQVVVRVIPETPPHPEGPCANSISTDTQNTLLLRSEISTVTMYPPVCLERGQRYRIRLETQGQGRPGGTAMLYDSVALLPRMDNIPFFQATRENELRKYNFERYQCMEYFKGANASFNRGISEDCEGIVYSVSAYVFDGAYPCDCNPQGSLNLICEGIGGQCPCKRNIVGRKCDRCAPGTYGFEGDGCTPCSCNSIGSQDAFCNMKSGECLCHENTYGQHCDKCQTGFWHFPSCTRCNCNGHADECDQLTGACISCQANTAGHECEICRDGYYGDPRLGMDQPCEPCPCPGTDPDHSFAKTCRRDRRTDEVICECAFGYAGPKCDICADNYYGNPDVRNGSCNPCTCNNNILLSRPGNCDSKTGKCLKCLFNTDGDNCEYCKDGYYGDAQHQMCRSCVCNILGTDGSAGPCDRVTGQCPCLPNVEGISCDSCKENHWKIASGEGCEHCDCFPIGVHNNSTQCNLYDGQCSCKSGFGGRKCDQCEATFWGDPELECYPCECNEPGSATLQCDRTNGSCVCEPGIGGSKCDECARGHIGHAPTCSPCGECFNNWDRILGELSDQTTRVVDAASKIKQQGATGAYTREFEIMQTRIDEVNELVKASNISASDLADLGKQIEDQRLAYGNTSEALDAATDVLANVSKKLWLTNASVIELEVKVKALQDAADSLKSNAINLQEANVEGALNLTRDAKRRSDEAVRRADSVSRLLADSKRTRDRIKLLQSELGPQLEQTQKQLNDALDQLEDSLEKNEAAFPELNSMVCDRGGNPCDIYCGGAGCGSCGGLSCNDGAVTTSENALKFAQDAYTELKKKDADAEELLRAVILAKEEVDEAKELAEKAFRNAEANKTRAEGIKTTLEELENEIQEFLNTSAATPKEIRELAKEVLSKNITLRPEQIDELASGIRESMSNLRNIEDILDATRSTLDRSEQLKDRADYAAANADKVLQDAVQVRDELDKTKEAQRTAENAIERAREDITAANLDLKQIEAETSEADKVSQESLKEVKSLEERLERLQRKHLENERMRDQVSKESESAFRNATEVQKQGAKLNEEYESVSKSLETKLKRFEGAKEKDELQGRANRLASNVNEKLVELTEMEREYTENDRKTADMLADINRLTRDMERYFQDIKRIEEYHRTCNS